MGQWGWIRKKRFRPFTNTFPPISLSLNQLRPYSRLRRVARGNRKWTGATPPFRCPDRARWRCAIHICAAPPGRVAPVPLIPAGRPLRRFLKTCCGHPQHPFPQVLQYGAFLAAGAPEAKARAAAEAVRTGGELVTKADLEAAISRVETRIVSSEAKMCRLAITVASLAVLLNKFLDWVVK